MKYKKIALIGMMGCGKSAVSKVLSIKTNILSYELDEIFEKKFNTTIKKYFELHGEKQFRIEEEKILQNISKKENFILSCGGGIILSEKNREILFEKDIKTIYLKTTPDEIFNRIKNDNSRPLLLCENPKEEIIKILNQRENFYNQANYKINTNNKDIENIAEEIIRLL